jgi:RNA polymerase sigma-70 factor (sigma-E family)
MEEYAAVFARHQGRLLRVAELVAMDADVAADAVAEAFARTYPHWRKGRVDDVGAYLRRAVLNEVSRTWRKRRPVAMPAAVASDRADRGADDVVERDRVVRALTTLPLRQRAAIVLRYYDDLSEADIAQTLGVAPGTVKSTLSRGLDRLRVLLQEGADHA